MDLVEGAARWNPVPDDRPARVWLPVPRTAAATEPSADVTREPECITLRVTPQQAKDLPLWIPRLLAQQDVRPGDRVTVDLGDLPSVHLTGLGLLTTVLWRRVGTGGEVLLAGGAPGLRAQLASIEVTPAGCRAAVYGPPPAPAAAPAAVPASVDAGLRAPCPGAAVPQQRQALHGPGSGHARLALSGDVNLTVDLRTQARLNELVDERGTRTLTIDLTDVTYLSLSTLRLLLAADRQLRARGGRLLLHHPNPQVQRLLAVTRATHLSEEQPASASCASDSPPRGLRPAPAVESLPVAGSGHARRRRSHSRSAADTRPPPPPHGATEEIRQQRTAVCC